MVPIFSRLLCKNRGFYHSLVEIPAHYIYHNDHEDRPYNRICSAEMDTTIVNYVKKVLLMILAGYGYAASSLYASYWKGNKTTIIAAKIPFVEEKSSAEYHLNLILMYIMFFHGSFVYLGGETTMTLFENFATVSPKLIHLELTECVAAYERKELSEAQLRLAFKNVSIQILDYERYFLLKQSHQFA